MMVMIVHLNLYSCEWSFPCKLQLLIIILLFPNYRLHLNTPIFHADHPWLQNAKKAPNVPLGETVRARLKQFSVMNKFKKRALKVNFLRPSEIWDFVVYYSLLHDAFSCNYWFWTSRFICLLLVLNSRNCFGISHFTGGGRTFICGGSCRYQGVVWKDGHKQQRQDYSQGIERWSAEDWPASPRPRSSNLNGSSKYAQFFFSIDFVL